jgi:hypothetical protein
MKYKNPQEQRTQFVFIKVSTFRKLLQSFYIEIKLENPSNIK